MERDFKGIWIPKEVWLKYRVKAALLICAYKVAPKTLSKQDIRFLRERGFLEKTNDNAKTIKELISRKKPQKSIVGDKTCEWCGATTAILHSHHYPIPKSEGGTKTVNICPNCHAEFHFLMYSEYKLTDEILKLFEEGEANGKKLLCNNSSEC